MISEQRVKDKLANSDVVLSSDLANIKNLIQAKNWNKALDQLNDLQNTIIALITMETLLKMED